MTFHFAKSRIKGFSYQEVNVDKIKDEFYLDLTKHIFSLTDGGNIDTLPDTWSFLDSSNISLCLEDFVNF